MSDPGPSTRRRYSLRTKILALFLSPILFLVFVEVAFQLAGYDPRHEAVFAELGERRLYLHHPRYFWTLRPNALLDELDSGFLRVRTNSLGLRGPEIPSPGPVEELRILCLGDSITFGLGLTEEDNWPHQVEQILARSPMLAGRPVIVANAGVPGWSSVQGMRLYRDLRSGGDWDFVVFCFGMNDARPAAGGIPDSWYRVEEGEAAEAGDLLGQSRIVQLLQYAAVGLGASSGRRRVSEEEFRSAVESLRAHAEEGGPETLFFRCPERMDETIHEFETMVAAAREAGVTNLSGSALLLSPYGPHFQGRPPAGRRIETDHGPALHYDCPPEELALKPLARAEDELAMLRGWKGALNRLTDLLPEDSISLEDVAGELPSNLLFQDNCHLVPRGARLVSDAIAREILRRLER